jgi:type VI secretion system protein ImpA
VHNWLLENPSEPFVLLIRPQQHGSIEVFLRGTMLSTASIETLLSPVSEALPSGDDLEYDPAFTALEASAQPKAEQQFGDTVIPAVEPEWRSLIGDATDLLQRSKDVRVAVLALRAATRTQGINGFSLGLSLLLELLERFWDTIHPQLDAADNNDPTMRLNALAPLADGNSGCIVLRDLYDCVIGTSRTVGAIRVRDIAIASNKLAANSGDAAYTMGQIDGALQDIRAEQPEVLEAAAGTAALVQKLQALLEAKTGRGDLIDLKPLRNITHLLRQKCSAAGGTAQDADGPADEAAHAVGAARSGGAVRGEISTRQDALQMLDKVILFLERTEPGNPAPLLIQRAKRLVGVSFMDIMNDLAPDALGSIQNITGKPP